MTTLVENSFALSTNLLKKDLREARRKEPVEGYLNILDNNKSSIADYSVEYDDGNAYLVIVFGIETQKILLSEQELSFGTRTYLTCACENRTNTLYLKNGTFACKTCQNLKYQSTTINRNSKHGKFIYQQNQILKLMTMRESIDRIFYRSRYSKRFTRYLELCEHIGLTKEVLDAQKLMEGINNYQQQV